MPTRTPPLIALVAAVALTGCLTGERPTLVDGPDASIDDPTALAVWERLDTADQRTFTATYSIIPTSTSSVTPATVESNNGRQRITIGAIEFLTDGERSRTCNLDTGECVDFLDDAQISNLLITHQFWGDSFAARLRLDAGRRVGFVDSSTADIAGRPATCADIPLPGIGSEPGRVRYCALDVGPLARYVGADVSIELTSLTDTANDIDI